MQESSFISSFKLFCRIFLFCAVVAAVFLKIGTVFEKAASKNVINYFTKARYDDFYALPPDSLDIAFLGSSHSYCTFDPENFDAVLGTVSHQMGTPLQHPDTMYYSLRQLLLLQKPRLVVAEVYWDMLDDDFEMKQANSFFEVLESEELYKEYIKEVFPLSEKVKYQLLPIRYQQDYFAYETSRMEKRIEEKFGVKKAVKEEPQGIEKYKGKGYVYCDWILPKAEYEETNQFRGVDGKKFQFSPVQKKYLEKIITLCKEQGIQLIFVTAPIANVSMEYIKNYDSIHTQIAAFAYENGIPYLDYNKINQDEKLLENRHFRDDAHLNDAGVKIVDAHFLQYLIDEFWQV